MKMKEIFFEGEGKELLKDEKKLFKAFKLAYEK
jgi:hypothetical protein